MTEKATEEGLPTTEETEGDAFGIKPEEEDETSDVVAVAKSQSKLKNLFALTEAKLRFLFGFGLLISMICVLTTSYKYTMFLPTLILCCIAVFAIQQPYHKTRLVLIILLIIVIIMYLSVATFTLVTMGHPTSMLFYWLIGDTPVSFAIMGYVQAFILGLCTFSIIRVGGIYRKQIEKLRGETEEEKTNENRPLLAGEVTEELSQQVDVA